MLRADFDRHPLWTTVQHVEEQLSEILEQNELSELPNVERIKVQIGYLKSFDVVASSRAAFFTPDMLLAVQSVWNQVESSLDARIANGTGYSSFVAQGADQAESALEKMAPWPRPYGRGGEVSQMNTLFEELLEAQRVSIDELQKRHEAFKEELENFRSESTKVQAEASDAFTQLEAETTQLENRIEAQKDIVEQAVELAETQIENLKVENTKSFNKWADERRTEFKAEFDPLHEEIGQKLKSAEDEYSELITAKEHYAKLVSAIAGDEVASAFQSEAKWARGFGIGAYIVGILLLAGAAIPLVWLLVEYRPSDVSQFDWTPLAIRLAIGVLAGSAATVAIRLGSRFIASADAAKRMELELRAIGPFLANVGEPEKVDNARLELVARSFGKAQASAQSSGKDEDGSLTLLNRFVELIDTALKTPKQ